MARVQAIHDATLATELLDAYRPGASYFSSPRHALLAEGPASVIPPPQGAGALTALAGLIGEHLHAAQRTPEDRPVAIGAIPFDAETGAHVVVPARVRRSGPLPARTVQRGAERANTDASFVPVLPPEGYAEAVEDALKRIRQTDLVKVVLSRAIDATLPNEVDVPGLLRALARRDPRGYTFAIDVPPHDSPAGDALTTFGAPDNEVPAHDASRTLIGASPELLIWKSGSRVTAKPLAGSMARSDDPAEDRRNGLALARSMKDRHEHAVVANYVAGTLAPFCTNLDVPIEPEIVHTATMWHFATEITGTLKDPKTSSLALAAALHPTPAVCGWPRDLARAAIDEIEPFERGFFTGLVGWCDVEGDGEWVVTIRCAEVEGRGLRLYAGAGIVAGSQPDAEVAETSAKLRPLLNALGVREWL